MTTWKAVPLMMTPAMHAAAAAAARQYMEATGGNNLDVIWAAALQAAPDKPAGHELEIIVTDRNNTYRARPRPGMATEKAGLKGTSASYTGGASGRCIACSKSPVVGSTSSRQRLPRCFPKPATPAIACATALS